LERIKNVDPHEGNEHPHEGNEHPHEGNEHPHEGIVQGAPRELFRNHLKS
jgi:hypothetical protein